MNYTDWITVSIETESNEQLKKIEGIDNYLLANANSIDILMIAASISLRENTPLTRKYGRGADIAHKNLLTSEHKWFMCMLYYFTEGDKDINSLRDRTAVVKNFEQYSQAGLKTLYERFADKFAEVKMKDELQKYLKSVSSR